MTIKIIAKRLLVSVILVVLLVACQQVPKSNPSDIIVENAAITSEPKQPQGTVEDGTRLPTRPADTPQPTLVQEQIETEDVLTVPVEQDEKSSPVVHYGSQTPVPPSRSQTKTPTTESAEAFLEHYERGKALSESEETADLKNAVEALSQAISLNPKYAAAYATRAGVYLDLEENQQALADAEKALELDPENDKAYDIKGFIHLLQGEYDLAMESFDQSIALNPQGGRVYYHRGHVYVQTGDLERGLADYTEALEIDPDSPKILQSRAWVNLSLGDADQALADINQAISLVNDDPGIYYDQGVMLRNLGRWEEAVDAYSHAIELDSDFAWAYHNRGNIYYDFGQFDKALSDLDRALALDPTDVLGFTNRGRTYIALGEKELAMADFDRALELDPAFPFAYQKRGESLLFLGEAEIALNDFDQAINLDPANPAAWTERARALAFLERFDEALDDLDRALELDPDNQYIDYLTGWVYLEMGDTEGALSRFDALLEQVEITFATSNASAGGHSSGAFPDPRAARGRLGRGRATMAMGQSEEALADFSQALTHDSGAIIAEINLLLNNGREENYYYLVRGLAHARNGEWDASDADFQEALDAGATPELISLFLVERSYAQPDLEQAVVDLQQAIELTPGNAGLHIRLGRMYLESDDLQKAVESFDRALHHKPDNRDGLALRGYVYSELGERGLAAENLCHSLLLMADSYAAGEQVDGDYVSLSDVISTLSSLEIDCYPPQDQVAGLPNWPAELNLPDSYQAHPLIFHGIAPGDVAINGESDGRFYELIIKDGFWFENYDGSEMIYGYAVRLERLEDFELFDSRPATLLKQSIEATYAGSEDFEILSDEMLDGSAEVGNYSIGEAVDYSYMGKSFHHEALNFRIDDIGFSLFQYYPTDGDPVVDIVQTGHLLVAQLGGL